MKSSKYFAENSVGSLNLMTPFDQERFREQLFPLEFPFCGKSSILGVVEK